MKTVRLATPEDVPAINEVLNHPAVRPRLEYRNIGALDFSGSIATHTAWVAPGSVVFVEPMGFGVYMGVSAFTPETQGVRSVVFHREVLEDFFTRMDAVKVLASVDIKNARAIRNLAGLGFMYAMPTTPARVVMSLDWINWALASRHCRLVGLAFFEARGEGCAWSEACMMGAFLLTAEKGEWIKALSQFNTWAGANQSRRLTLIHKDDLMFRLGGIVFALNQEKAA